MTLAQIQAALVEWNAALVAAASGKAYTIGDRQLTRHDIGDIRDTITWLERKEQAATSSAAGSGARASLACWNNCDV